MRKVGGLDDVFVEVVGFFEFVLEELVGLGKFKVFG